MVLALADSSVVNFQVTAHKSSFGLSGVSATSVVTEIKVQSGLTHDKSINLVLVVDVSGSMYGRAIDKVKASLLALRDVICDLEDNPDLEQADKMLRERSRIVLITFANTATIAWDSDCSDKRFDEVVGEIKAGGQTNLDHGLRIAKSVVSELEEHSWMMLLTDGYANIGNVDVKHFEKLFDSINTKCQSVAIGVIDYSSYLLANAKNLVHVHDVSVVLQVIGNILAETKSLVGYRARVFYYIPSKDKNARMVVGSSNIGILVSGDKYRTCVLPTGSDDLSDYKEAVIDKNCLVVLKYTDLDGNLVVMERPVNLSDEPLSEEIMEMYYACSAARIVKSLLCNPHTVPYAYGLVERAKRWYLPCAKPFTKMVKDAYYKLLRNQIADHDRHVARSCHRRTETQRSYSKVLACDDYIKASPLTSTGKQYVKSMVTKASNYTKG